MKRPNGMYESEETECTCDNPVKYQCNCHRCNYIHFGCKKCGWNAPKGLMKK